MNLGNQINALRKARNITQEELAAELGVTAAAVSKWENGYTLPDVLMLCALADHFEVTTDELLGRTAVKKQAIIAAQTEALGRKIADLAQNYNICTIGIYTDYNTALAAAGSGDKSIQYLFSAMDHPLEERETDDTHGVIHVNVHFTNGTDEDALNGIELYLKNMDAFRNITDLTATGKK